MDEQEINQKAQEIVDVFGETSYFNCITILEAVREILRLDWMNDVAKSGAFRK